MRRSLLKTLLAIAAPALVAGALPGCATNDNIMFIVGVGYAKAGACQVKPDLEAPTLAKGAMDRLFASEYTAILVVGNQVMERGSRERVRAETSQVSIKGAEVKIETPQGGEVVPAFSSLSTGFIDASDGTDAAVATISATLIPASVAPLLPRGTVVAKVRVFGTTLGGEEVESSELSFPIEICDGCLVRFEAQDRDLAASSTEFECKLATDEATSAGSSVDSACTAGIDFSVPCTACSGLYAACQNPNNNCAYNPDACP
jgi:hypothetical protein